MPERLRCGDYSLIVVFCLVLCSVPLFTHRTLTTHETVHCQNVREMRCDGDWIIPHYGGRVWMERPPLPFWTTMAVVEVVGDSPMAYRLAAFLVGLPCVLLVGWMASVWFGRGIGLTAGLILATMQEFTHYITGPEADIFLCLIVTAALAMFVHLQFQRWPAPEESRSFVGGRPWALLGFFALLGLANLTKGLFFGDVFILLPIAVFLLANADLSAIRRYIWLPGWVAFLLVGAAWPVAAYLRYPDVLDFWKSDYLGRVNQGYMQEPFWYYFVQLPVVLFPWSLPAVYGLWLTRHAALREPGSPERFLWCWAVVPVLFFSIPQGKHHHYLLSCMAPWAVLSARGAVAMWEYAKQTPWLEKHWRTLVALAIVGDVALLIAAWKVHIPGPAWIVPAMIVGWPAMVLLAWWGTMHRDGRVAMGSVCAIFAVVYWGSYVYRSEYWDAYQQDSEFVQQACATVPIGAPLYVMDDDAPLHASWLLFYIPDRATLLHNVTFLLDDHITAPELYLIARAKTAKALRRFGTHEVLLQSVHSRYQFSPDDRYTLFRVHLDPGLAHQSGVRISPMQATGRAPGPFLVPALVPADVKLPWPYEPSRLTNLP
jgi:4-amino-4-deoxy-L-arabinose transferase-like glycosyltransferase